MTETIPVYGSPEYDALPIAAGHSLKQRIFLDHYGNRRHFQAVCDRYRDYAEPEVFMALYTAALNPKAGSVEDYLHAPMARRWQWLQTTPIANFPADDWKGRLFWQEWAAVYNSAKIAEASFPHICALAAGNPRWQEAVQSLRLREDLGIGEAEDISFAQACEQRSPQRFGSKSAEADMAPWPNR